MRAWPGRPWTELGAARSRGPGGTGKGCDISPEIAPGTWYVTPSLVGPFSGPAAATVSAGMAARTRAFDQTVTSPTGDPLLADVGLTGATVAPVTIAPGASATIPVTCAPAGRRGSIDAGEVFVDDIDPSSGAITEVGAVPYAYRVGRHHRRR